MKRFHFVFPAVVFSLCITLSAQAGSISVLGDTGDRAPGSNGILQIAFDTGPENRTFLNGSIGLALTADTPNVIQFGQIDVINGGRWATTVPAAGGAISSDASDTGAIKAFSVATSGLPSGPNVIYATVAYSVVGAPGSSTFVSVATSGPDPLYDGSVNPPFGDDVSGEFTFNGATVGVVGIPEPSTIALAGLSLIGLVLRRRNG